MNEDGVLVIVAAITSILLIISEILGLSKCKANAILELYKNFSCTNPTRERHYSEEAVNASLDRPIRRESRASQTH